MRASRASFATALNVGNTVAFECDFVWDMQCIAGRFHHRVMLPNQYAGAII